MFSKSEDGQATPSTADCETSSHNVEPKQSEQENSRPTGLRLALIVIALCLGTFLCALDTTILATAIPTITSYFHSLDDVSWYNASYLLCVCGFQLPFGRAYTLLSTKWTFLVAIVIFEVGSAVSGSAPSSIALIIGRAVQGVGASGIFGGAFIIIAENTPLRKRSLFVGFLAAMFAIASVVGPLLGGVFTDKVSWRWCFYINLPLGAITLVVVTFFLPASNKASIARQGKTWLQIIAKFDPIGTLILVPSIISLLLALQWGGITYPWSDARITGLFVCFGASILIWAALQWWQGDDATVPWSVIKRRSVFLAVIYMLCGSAAFAVVVYYLPTWFQAIKQVSAFESGIHSLPLILSVAFSTILGGAGVAWIGYYNPFLYFGTICMSVGAGLLMTLNPSSTTADWIGYQILIGVGIGASLEQCNIAVQAALPDEQVAAGTSLTVFARSLGGSLAVSIGQNVFLQELQTELRHTLPNLNPDIVSGSGATDLLSKVKKAVNGNETLVKEILGLYNHAVTRTFMVALILGCLTVVPALAIEWRSVKKEKKGTMSNGQDESEKLQDDVKEDV